MVTGNFIKSNRDVDLVAACDSTPELSNVCSLGMERSLIERFLEFKDFGGKSQTITVTTKVVMAGQVQSNERWVTIICYPPQNDLGRGTLEKWWSVFSET